MARPQKEGLDYFSHDTDAVNDEKIEALRALHGNNGYAFYFILLERIYRTNEAELDVSDAETIQILSRKVAVTTEEFMQMLETAFRWKCFDREAYEKRGVLTSNGIKKRTSVVVEKRATMRDKYQKKKEEVSDAETREETEQKPDKVKKRKEKESKEKHDNKAASSAIVNSFNENIHPITPIEYEKLTAYLDDGFDHIVILYAIERAVTAGKRNLAYIEGILKRLREANLKTMQAVEAAERDWQAKKNSGKKEAVRGDTEYKVEPPPDSEQMQRNQEFMRDLLQNIGKGM